jgi:hypothetical protein
LASKIKKEDGQPISAQYLNDIGHDRRNPPSGHLLEQFAHELDKPVEVFYYWAGELPADLKGQDAEEEQIVTAYQAFRKKLKK